MLKEHNNVLVWNTKRALWASVIVRPPAFFHMFALVFFDGNEVLQSLKSSNPLTTIFYMRYYREAVFKRFRKAQARVTDTTTINSLQGTATALSGGTASR